MGTENRSHLKRLMTTILAALLIATVFAPAAHAGSRAKRDRNAAYRDAIDRVSGMIYDDRVWELAQRHGLDVVNVAWEDTGRYDNSAVGPNISDVTIQVPRPIEGTDDHTLALMPVIRYPNFTDLSGDVDIDKIHIPVGNEQGDRLHAVTLEEYLGNIDDYLSDGGGVNRNLSLLAERDTHVLVSAQAAFLPVPQEGNAHFNPVIFNYQSYEGNPAVLTIVVTSEGTSATIIDNVRDGFSDGWSWGQRLFFNEDGQRASFTGERASDGATDRSGDAEAEFADPVPEPRSSSAEATDESVVLIIQVPLKHEGLGYELFEDDAAGDVAYSAEPEARSDLDSANIGHGPVEGPFTELAGLEIERDPDFPVRVTVQFYKATATGEVTADDMAAIAADIDRVYEEADYVGSLVTDGLRGRPTEYDGNHTQPGGWWAAFRNRWPSY